MNIGKVIRALRTERGDSLETLAFEVGTDASNLSRIERGLQQPSEDVLKAIAAAPAIWLLRKKVVVLCRSLSLNLALIPI